MKIKTLHEHSRFRQRPSRMRILLRSPLPNTGAAPEPLPHTGAAPEPRMYSLLLPPPYRADRR